MGRKSAASVEKQLRRKVEKKQLAEWRGIVKKANEQTDPMEGLDSFRTYTKDNLQVRLEVKRVREIEEKVFDWIFKLEKENMEDLYKSCSWGWDEERKKAEMKEELAWYLIPFDSATNAPVAFSHFRFDMDFGEKVLYLYEIQLEPGVRRKKLGKLMVQLLELIAFRNEMNKVILTVLKHNPGSLEFFSALNYTLDPTSPEDSHQEPYLILSKINKRLINNKG